MSRESSGSSVTCKLSRTYFTPSLLAANSIAFASDGAVNFTFALPVPENECLLESSLSFRLLRYQLGEVVDEKSQMRLLEDEE